MSLRFGQAILDIKALTVKEKKSDKLGFIKIPSFRSAKELLRE